MLCHRLDTVALYVLSYDINGYSWLLRQILHEEAKYGQLHVYACTLAYLVHSSWFLYFRS